MEVELVKVALTLDDDGGLKQKKIGCLSLMIVSSRRSISDLCTRFTILGWIDLGSHACNHIHRLTLELYCS
jgi:hypothetical protein